MALHVPEFVRMIGSSVPVGWCEVVWNGYCLVNYLVKECEACDCPACVERLPPQVGEHSGNAAVGWGWVGVVVEGETVDCQCCFLWGSPAGTAYSKWGLTKD